MMAYRRGCIVEYYRSEGAYTYCTQKRIPEWVTKHYNIGLYDGRLYFKRPEGTLELIVEGSYIIYNANDDYISVIPAFEFNRSILVPYDISMGFLDAMIRLTGGEDLRRDSWPLGNRLHINPNTGRLELYCGDQINVDFSLTSEDVTASDWRIA